jgi:membrane protease subunit HflK
MGLCLNLLISDGGLPFGEQPLEATLVPAWLKVSGALGFLGMGVLTARRRRWWSRCVGWLDARLPFPVTHRGAVTAVGVVVVLAYLAFGFFTVQPGEVGTVRRFGAIVRWDLPPGLHYAWPYPIDVTDRIPVRRVNRLVLGFGVSEDPASEPAANIADSWTLIGDENIADLKTAVHWGAIPEQALQYAYGVADREGLVRAATLGAIREVLGGKSINRGFTTERRDCEARIEELIRQRLASYQSGIRIDSFHFLDAHAPSEVHDAFRDVASALEDKSTQINLALAQEARVVPLARGDAERLRAEAEGYAFTAVGRSQGETQRFADLLREYQRWPGITRQRLYFETIDTVLPGMRKYLKPGADDTGEIEIWLVNPRVGANLPWQSEAEMR